MEYAFPTITSLSRMLITAIAALALAANPPQAATHDVWEADIELPAATSPVYLLQFDDDLEDAIQGLRGEWFDVVDAQGKTMPRGVWSSWSGAGPQQETLLALTNRHEQLALPQMCTLQPRPPDCAAFDREPSLPASTTMASRLSVMHAAASLGAGAGQVSSATSGSPGIIGGLAPIQSNPAAAGPRLGPTPRPSIPMPLAWDVTDIAAAPAETADWTHRRLAFTWKSPLPPDAIGWQIGHDVARITPGDRTLLKEDQGDGSWDGWNARLLRAWRGSGRLMTFDVLDAAQRDGDLWRIEIPLKGLVGNDALQIASAPAGAVELVEMHLIGSAPRTLPQTEHRERSLRLAPMPDGAWRVIDQWPKSMMFGRLQFTLEQSRMLLDSRIEKIDYQMLTAAGRVKNVTVVPFQFRANAAEIDGISAGFSMEAADPITQLQQSSSTQPLPLPAVVAQYKTATLWFEAAGVAPYRLKVGAKSARRSEQMPGELAEQLGAGGKLLVATVHLPMATLQNPHKTGTFTEASPAQTDDEARAKRLHSLAMIIAAASAFAVFGLIMLDRHLRAKIAALREDRP